MAFGNFTLTGHFETLDGVPATGRVQVDGIPQVVIDTAGNKFRVGPRTVILNATGDFSISLPSNATTGSSTTIGYRVTALLKHQNVAPVEFYAPAIASTVDLADITPQSVVALTPTAVSQADFNAYVASNPGATNSTIAGYVTATGSTKTALDAAYTPSDKLAIDARTKGVTANGTTDDTAALTAAITVAASPASKSSVVMLPPGTTLVSGIDLPSAVRLKGHAFGSRLKLKNGSNRPVIRTAAATTQAVVIEDLVIDGNKANQTGGVSHGIHLNNQAAAINPSLEQFLSDCYHTVTNVLITNCDGDGLRTTGRGDTNLTEVKSYLHNGDGFRIDSFDTLLTGCIAGVCLGQGFNVTMPNVTLTNCKAFMNANGFAITSVRGILATGLVAQGNYGDGVLLTGAKDCRIEVSAFDSNYGQSATALTGVGVRFLSGSDRNRVLLMASNQELAAQPNRQQAAYYIPSGSQNVIDVTTDGTMPLRPSSSNDRGNVVNMRGTDGFVVDAFTATFTPDLSSGTTRQMTLTGSTVISRPTMGGNTISEYFPEGISATFVFTQDATGGRTVSWGAGFIDKKWQPNPAPNSTSVCTWRMWGGVNWQIVSGTYPATALTAADASVVDTTYGTEEAAVINNLRTRLNALETLLQKQGSLL